MILIFVYSISLIWIFLMPSICRKFHLPEQIIHQLPYYLTYFICGMFFFFNWDFMNRHLVKFFIPSLIVLILFYFIKFPTAEIFIPFALSCVVMFLGTHLTICNPIGSKNDYSYSMYLIHYPLIMIFRELNFFTEKPFIALICIFTVTFTSAYLIEEIKKYCKEISVC